MQAGDQGTRERLQEVQSQLARLHEHRSMLDVSAEQISAGLDRLTSERDALQGSLDERDSSKKSSASTAGIHESKRQALLARMRECQSRLDALTLPIPDPKLSAEFAQAPSEVILRRLHSLTEQLRSTGPVNRKAAEQFCEFTQEASDLVQRQTDLDVSAKSLEEFIRVLDQRKDESITRTFDQVAANFSLVFSRLVPLGNARLEMQRALLAGQMQYTGISIKVLC